MAKVEFNPQHVIQKRAEIMLDAEAIFDVAVAEDRELTTDESERMEQLLDKHKDMEKDVRQAEKYAAARKESISARAQQMITTQGTIAPQVSGDPITGELKPAFKLPAIVKDHMHLMAFDEPEEAYKCGMFMKAAFLNDQHAKDFCTDNSIQITKDDDGMYGMVDQRMQGNIVGTDAKGGYLVPTLLAAQILKVVNQWTAAREAARIFPMSGESVDVPKWEDGVKVYKPAELNAITESDVTYSQVNLRATDAFTLTRISNRLLRENVISAADQVVSDGGRRMAKQLDFEFILADGTAGDPNWSATGLLETIKPAGVAGDGVLVAATGQSTWDLLTKESIDALVGYLPAKYHTDNTRFICSRSFWATVLEPLLEERAYQKTDMAGATPRMLKGYPVTFSEHMPTSTAVSQVSLLFGDFFESSLIGIRQEVTVALSQDRYFELDALAIRIKASWDVQNHRGADVATGPETGLPNGFVGLSTSAT